QISMAQAAFLAVIPRSPVHYDPRRHFARVRTMQQRLLSAMIANNKLAKEARFALAEPITVEAPGVPFEAPHFTRRLRSGLLSGEQRINGRMNEVHSSLDMRLQRRVESIVKRETARLKSRRVTNGAVVVLDNKTGDVLAYVGSADYSDKAHQGAVDGVVALRQPGSTLKPFTYALALERGFTAATILPDIETNYKLRQGHSFVPRNYSGHFLGPVRLRSALASSLNVPAVFAAKHVGYKRLLQGFLNMGFVSLKKHADHYGLGITLGNGEVALLDLATAYAALARGGRSLTLRFFSRVVFEDGGQLFPPAAVERQVIDEKAAYIITNILADPMARISGFGFSTPFAFPYPVAVKTGTSSSFRDNLAIGYTREVTVAVWVGNFDGTPMERVTGATGAGPIFRQTLLAAMEGKVPEPFASPLPMVEIPLCPLSGLLPGPHCKNHIKEIFVPGSEPKNRCTWHEEVRLDSRNMLLAGPSCSDEEVIKKVFARFPPTYSSWIKEEGIVVAPDAWSPHCPGKGKGTSAAKIISPHDQTQLLIDPSEPLENQVVAIKVEAAAGDAPGVWIIDNRPASPKPWPYTLYWQLVKGTHTFALRIGSTTSNKITLHIR
ncbi:penicillin-binding protein 1C, partial [Myxococcota bacterium]|nr:penicillin-binding protein 1C [Myxococcota bacterium]